MGVEKWVTEDGLRAERRVTENADEKVIEVYMEDGPPQLKLKQKITERIKPMVYEREVQSIDSEGRVEVKLESIDPNASIALVKDTEKASEKVSEKEYVTKEEMVDAIVAGIKAARSQGVVDNSNQVNSLSLSAHLTEKFDTIDKGHMLKVALIGLLVVEICLGLFYLLWK